MVAVDPDVRRLTLDCHGERVTLEADYLDDRTVHGDPTLLHGYASTIHVAQGLTVDHAFVLAGPGLNRESGYTALSRGRHTNRLYAARDPDVSRAEFAPVDPHRGDAIARLRTQLGTSSANTLAIDVGRSAPERGVRVADARHLHALAAARRRSAEVSRGRWLPGRRRQLDQLRRAEVLAAGRVEDLRREELELRHAAQAFVTEDELDARLAKTVDRFKELRVERELDRGRDAAVDWSGK